jgi:hypothetical protein
MNLRNILHVIYLYMYKDMLLYCAMSLVVSNSLSLSVCLQEVNKI